ncbi:hypothetical protein B1812_18410 [Methylocystis bryophila]|uniref:Uncharacterized protein n=1 Tax=Methylocystis bryophila TaxID=655015 RepID=A0A1W6MYR9_9HYPH|nr:hypothetical protein B1812_18410 [Methylocystis bryophila]
MIGQRWRSLPLQGADAHQTRRFATATCWGGTHFFWRRLEAASIFGEVVTFKFFGPGPLPEA